MFPHVDITKQFPSARDAYLAFGKEVQAAATSAGLSTILVELIRIRVAQLNGCAYCLRAHTRAAVAAGESADRLAVLPAWWESQYFTEQEQAALSLAERVTRVADEHTAPPAGIDVAQVLTPAQVAAVTWIAIEIGGWNRIAVTSHLPVGS
ncbi:carboxymuconolactone decarboxylase family protein [Promicromonospora sp. NPDC050880]|uniref:carboxymuconolactone decarboxylase family protein n=1 Tax=Promicromonospora sp. NPDC050880 TaxID=3364406 RepID=UPI0037A86F0F